MVKHIVTFKFKGTESERLNIANKFKEALILLPEQIDVLQSIEVGINQNPIEKWDLVLTATVDSIQDVAIYAQHPAHVASTSAISGKVDERACVDYEPE